MRSCAWSCQPPGGWPQRERLGLSLPRAKYSPSHGGFSPCDSCFMDSQLHLIHEPQGQPRLQIGGLILALSLKPQVNNSILLAAFCQHRILGLMSGRETVPTNYARSSTRTSEVGRKHSRHQAQGVRDVRVWLPKNAKGIHCVKCGCI